MADGIRSQSRNVTALGTFRDPSGSAVLEPDRVLRYLTEAGHSALLEFLDSPLAAKLTEDGSIVATRRLGELRGILEGADPGNRARRFTHLVQHDRIPLVSYPCEWSVEQLFDAGRLTLDLAEQALQHGFVLKDATPYNVLFHSGKPVFVDIPSFTRRNPLASAWGAGGQFTRQFLLPLLAHKLGIPKVQSSFLTHRDGLEARELRALPGFSKFLKRGYISMVAGPLLLERFSKQQSEESNWEPVASTPEKAEYTMRWLIGSFRRQLRAVEPKRSVSTHWSTYQQKVPSYSPEEFARKREFVDEVLGIV
ncbi:MAG: hypothetical protein LC114_14470, partial [Bryobacterales bacterium]|nr:hypothetical protein [Bryobacterales bacterium]